MATLRTLLAAACVLPALAFAQSLAYMDADTPSEAVGMMKSTIYMAGKLEKACAGRYPQIGVEIAENHLKWREAEGAVIRKTEFYWARMVEKAPKLADSFAYAESVVLKNLDMLGAAPGEAGVVVGTQFCRKHFEDLASGVWRTRTPRAYAYLDKAP
jgi:hypothetical protein